MKYARTKQNQFVSRDARDRANLVEAARRALPINTYLLMLNHAALTGDLPVVDTVTGQLTSQTEKISNDSRLELAKYLVNKCLPDLQRVTPAEDDGLKDAESNKKLTSDDVQALDSDMLRALITANDGVQQAERTESAEHNPQRAG